MGKFEEGNKKGKKISSDNQPPNRGRKPKLYTIAKKAYNLSYSDFKDMRCYLMQLSRKELEDISKAVDTPIWIAILCRSYLKGASKGETQTLEETKMDLWGREVTSIKDKNSPVAEEPPRTLTKEEAKELWNSLNDEY